MHSRTGQQREANEKKLSLLKLDVIFPCVVVNGMYAPSSTTTKFTSGCQHTSTYLKGEEGTYLVLKSVRVITVGKCVGGSFHGMSTRNYEYKSLALIPFLATLTICLIC